MGIFANLFRRKSFDELMDEHYSVSQDYLSGGIDEKTVLERQHKILRQAAKAAKDDKQRLIVNACLIELEKQRQAVQAGIVRKG